ncbi:4-hydroxyphenylacetate 3-monooxygenase, oxygenase component [soil metagenome]
MTIRTGAQYIERLKNTPREVWLKGQRVDDVTEHPALRGPIAQIAALYDMQHDPATRDILTREYEGRRVPVAFIPPRSYEDLVARRAAFQVVADATFGLMGRSPDFLNTTLMALAEASEVFGRDGQRFADNMVRYFEYIRENDLFLTHALLAPQTDRTKASSEQKEEFLHMGVVRETDEGLIMRGARMLATLAPVADELLVYNAPGLKPGDERYCTVFAIPIDSPGLRLITREPFDDGSRNSYDHPLSSNFEEADSLLVFDDVLVPWDRVFVHNNVELSNALYIDSNLRQHTGHQTGVRGLTKMEFITGIAMKLSQSVKIDQFQHVQQKLGEAIAATEICRALIVASETNFETDASGVVRPNLNALQTLRMHLSSSYPKIAELLQTLGAGGYLMMPSAEDFLSPIAGDIEKYLQGAGGLPAEDRVRLYKLAWDLCGDGFGQRTLQYERYYAGDPVRLLAANYLAYNKDRVFGLVDKALSLAGTPQSALQALNDRQLVAAVGV